jgi:hypothetical protein
LSFLELLLKGMKRGGLETKIVLSLKKGGLRRVKWLGISGEKGMDVGGRNDWKSASS